MNVGTWVRENSQDTILSYVVELTKDDARWLLEHNRLDNRDMWQPKLVRLRDEFIELMNKGEWKLTHQALCFDASDRLLDGQNRLQSFLDSNCETMTFLVFIEWEEDIFGALDSGATRTVAEHLHLDNTTSQYVQYIARLAQGTLRKKPRVTDAKPVYEAVKSTIEEFEKLGVPRREGISRLSVRGMVLLRYHFASPELRLHIANQWRILHTDFVDHKPDRSIRDLKSGLEAVNKIKSNQDVDELRAAMAWMAFDPENQKKGIPKRNPGKGKGKALFSEHRMEFMVLAMRLAGKQSIIRRKRPQAVITQDLSIAR